MEEIQNMEKLLVDELSKNINLSILKELKNIYVCERIDKIKKIFNL